MTTANPVSRFEPFRSTTLEGIAILNAHTLDRCRPDPKVRSLVGLLGHLHFVASSDHERDGGAGQ